MRIWIHSPGLWVQYRISGIPVPVVQFKKK